MGRVERGMGLGGVGKGTGGCGKKRWDANLALWWHGKGLVHVKMVRTCVKRVRVCANW